MTRMMRAKLSWGTLDRGNRALDKQWSDQDVTDQLHPNIEAEQEYEDLQRDYEDENLFNRACL